MLFDVEVAELVVGRCHAVLAVHHFSPFLSAALLQSLREIVFDLADLDVGVPSFVEFLAIFIEATAKSVIYLLQQVFVFLINCEDKVLKR